MLNSRVVGARRSFHIFEQNTLLLENTKASPKFFYGILHYLIIIINS